MPGSGDSIQALKAGVMEIPDVIAVNKADHPLTDTMVREIRGVLSLGPQQGWRVPIVKTEASARRGHRGARREDRRAPATSSRAEGTLDERRRRNLMNEVVALAAARLRRRARGAGRRRPRGAGAARRGRRAPARPRHAPQPGCSSASRLASACERGAPTGSERRSRSPTEIARIARGRIDHAIEELDGKHRQHAGGGRPRGAQGHEEAARAAPAGARRAGTEQLRARERGASATPGASSRARATPT